jgi:hypothetical protein
VSQNANLPPDVGLLETDAIAPVEPVIAVNALAVNTDTVKIAGLTIITLPYAL